MIRKAQEADIDSIEEIYNRIHDGEEKGLTTIGWIRNVYPIRKTAEDALGRGDLFVMEEENQIVASAVINQIQVDVYKNADWKRDASESEVMVLHGLAVNPLENGKGYGRAFVAFYEDYARIRERRGHGSFTSRLAMKRLGLCRACSMAFRTYS